MDGWTVSSRGRDSVSEPDDEASKVSELESVANGIKYVSYSAVVLLQLAQQLCAYLQSLAELFCAYVTAPGSPAEDPVEEGICHRLDSASLLGYLGDQVGPW